MVTLELVLILSDMIAAQASSVKDIGLLIKLVANPSWQCYTLNDAATAFCGKQCTVLSTPPQTAHLQVH